MADDTYVSFIEYMKSTSGAVVLFVLVNPKGKELTRQIVPADELVATKLNTCSVKFTVDEALSAKMIPGEYTLYLYVGVPSSSADLDNLTADDYTLNKCLTEQGIRIRVRGGLNEPSVGTGDL